MSTDDTAQEKVHSGTSVALRIFAFLFGTIALLLLVKYLFGL